MIGALGGTLGALLSLFLVAFGVQQYRRGRIDRKRAARKEKKREEEEAIAEVVEAAVEAAAAGGVVGRRGKSSVV